MSEGERVAVLEAVVEDLHDDMDEVKSDLRAIRDSLAQVELAISKHKGFFGGVVFTIGAVAGVVGAIVASIWHKLVT